MGEGFDRILGAAETLILHRCGDPDKLLPRAGQRLGFKRRVSFAERGIGQGAKDYATGAGFLSVDEELKIHPNDVKELPRGECFVIAGGRAQRVLVKRVALPAKRPSEQLGLAAPPNPAAPQLRIAAEAERPPQTATAPLAITAERAPAREAPQAPTSEPEISPAAEAAPAYPDEDRS
jgi:hypothetical protein